jgi:hypothetical protein
MGLSHQYPARDSRKGAKTQRNGQFVEKTIVASIFVRDKFISVFLRFAPSRLCVRFLLVIRY